MKGPLIDKHTQTLTHDHEDDGSEDHQDGLDEVGPHDGREASGNAEGRSQYEQDQNGKVQAWKISSESLGGQIIDLFYLGWT